MRLHQPVGVRDPHDRGLRHRRVLQQAALHLGRREPFARHLEQLVGPAAVGVVPVGVAPDQVSGHHPLAPEAGLTLVQLLPVAQRPRPATHPQVPHRAVGHLPALLVHHLHLEPRHHLTQGPAPHPAHPVGEEDVPLLRGAESVEEGHAEEPIPPVVQRLGQALARGGGEAQRGEVLPARLRMAHHLVDHGGDGDQDRRPVPCDPLEDGLRGAVVGEQHAGGARGEREQEIGAHRVAEVELGHRERHIPLGIAEHVAGVALRAVHVRAVRLHRGLGAAGGAAGEEPDRGVVAVGGEVAPGVRRRIEARRPLALAPDEQPGCMRGPGGHGAKRIGVLRAHQRRRGAAVLEEIPDRVGLELRVDHHYDGADLQDAEQRRHEVGPVGQGDDHALLRRHARRGEHVGIAVRPRLHLAVAPPSGVGQQRGPVSPTLAHPGIEEVLGDIQVGRRFGGHGECTWVTSDRLERPVRTQ